MRLQPRLSVKGVRQMIAKTKTSNIKAPENFKANQTEVTVFF